MEDENEDIIMNSNGMGNGVIPERRHSSTEGSRSSRGEVTVRLNRRHSLPGGSSGTDTSSGGTEGCVIEIHGDRETGSEGSEEVMNENQIKESVFTLYQNLRESINPLALFTPCGP